MEEHGGKNLTHQLERATIDRLHVRDQHRHTAPQKRQQRDEQQVYQVQRSQVSEPERNVKKKQGGKGDKQHEMLETKGNACSV